MEKRSPASLQNCFNSPSFSPRRLFPNPASLPCSEENQHPPSRGSLRTQPELLFLSFSPLPSDNVSNTSTVLWYHIGSNFLRLRDVESTYMWKSSAGIYGTSVYHIGSPREFRCTQRLPFLGEGPSFSCASLLDGVTV